MTATKTERAPKQYDVYCITKANSHQYLHHSIISADTSKEACECMKRSIEISIGRHAFGTTTAGLPKNWDWDYICKDRNITADQIKAYAYARDGWQIDKW